jgi:hypothetical protein
VTARRFVVASALLIPALVFASCSDGGNTHPAGPQVPQEPQVPSTQGGGLDFAKIKKNWKPVFVPEASTAELAAAVKADAEAANADAAAGTFSLTPSGTALHDPTVPGMHVRCLSGADLDTPVFARPGLPPEPPSEEGTATEFRNNRGCQLDTRDTDNEPGNEAAAVVTSQDLLSGRLLQETERLEFFYAGGPAASEFPWMELYIDRCTFPEPVDFNGGLRDCPEGSSTDGVADDIILLAPILCAGDLKGGGFQTVGAVNVVGPNVDESKFCGIFSFMGGRFTTWKRYLEDHPGARYALTVQTPTGNVPVRSGLIRQINAGLRQHFLVYRVDVRARNLRN